MAGTKTKSQSHIPNPFERYIDSGSAVSKAVAKTAANEASESGKTFIEQLLGLNIKSKDKEPKHADGASSEQKVSSGLEVIDLFIFDKAKINASEKKDHKEKAPRIEAAINYGAEIARSSERAAKSETHQMNQNIKEIQHELKQLLQSSKVLQMEFAEVAVEQAPVDAGQYHMNFFEWMLATIRQARHKVEDSGAWLNTVKGKGGKKGKTNYDITNGAAHQAGERTTIQNSVG